jgi:aspartate 1-decarboxylase
MNEVAAQLGLTVDALMAANGLTDPDTLSAGQVLLVPEVDDQVPSTGSQPTPTATPPPQDTGDPAVQIRGVSGAGILEAEVVQVLNSGGTANLEGWTLDNGRGSRYVFPAFTLHNGAVSVHTRSGRDTVIDLYWGMPEAVWTSGTVVTLRDSEGKIQSMFSIP